MKKIVAAILALTMCALCLCGCGAKAPFEVGKDSATYAVEGASSWAGTVTANVKIVADKDVLFCGPVTVTSDSLYASEFIYAAINEKGLSQSGVLEGFITAIGSYVCEGNMYWMWEYQGHNPTNFAINEVHIFDGDYILVTFVDTSVYFQY